MGNSNSVMIEVSAKILEILVDEYAGAIMPNIKKIYMDDRSLNNGAHSPSKKFNPYGFCPNDTDLCIFLYKCAQPFSVLINMSRIVYREEKYIISIIHFLNNYAPKNLFQIKNSIDANYVGTYVGRRIMCDELNIEFNIPKYFPEEIPIYHNRLPEQQLNQMRTTFYNSPMGGQCNDNELSLKFAQLLTSSMGTMQRNIHDIKSKPSIISNKVKKEKLVKYFNESVEKLVEVRMMHYTELCKNSFGKKYHEYNNGTLQNMSDELNASVNEYYKDIE